MTRLLKNQPVAVAGVINALIGLAIAFGIPISSEQSGCIMALAAAITALVVWPNVSPTTQLEQPGKHEMPDSS